MCECVTVCARLDKQVSRRPSGLVRGPRIQAGIPERLGAWAGIQGICEWGCACESGKGRAHVWSLVNFSCSQSEKTALPAFYVSPGKVTHGCY